MSAREELLDHVRAAQRTRSCAGCGLCCMAPHNAVRILPLEGARIAEHLNAAGRKARAAWRGRLDATIRSFRLRRARPAVYTCSFLEPDMRCALPVTIKPIACLAFNPITREHCDQEPAWFERAHAEVRIENERRGLLDLASPIPVAVRDALEPDTRPRATRRPP